MTTKTSLARASGSAALAAAAAAIGVAVMPATASAQAPVTLPEVAVDHASGTSSVTVTVRNPNPAGLVGFTFCQAYVVPAGAWNAEEDTVLDLIPRASYHDPTAVAMLVPVPGGEQATYTVDHLAAGRWEVVGMCDDLYLDEMNAAAAVVGDFRVGA
jgi:hypothetical protein